MERDYKESRIYFEKGIKLAQTVQNNSMLSLLYHHLGMSFRMDNQLSKALLYTDKSLRMKLIPSICYLLYPSKEIYSLN